MSRKRGPFDGDFERGYVPCDEPPGLEECEYARWKHAGGKVLDRSDWNHSVITVREYFAAAALTGLLANSQFRLFDDEGAEIHAALAASNAFELADAMIAASRKGD